MNAEAAAAWIAKLEAEIRALAGVTSGDEGQRRERADRIAYNQRMIENIRNGNVRLGHP